MLVLGPAWTREIKLSTRKLDPLGLSSVSDWLVNQLVPGIMALTKRARNYSFYCWAIDDILTANQITSRTQFRSEFVKRETAFVMASILHESKNPNPKNPYGVEKCKWILESKDEEFDTGYSVSDGNPEGFYGLYYQNALRQLGLTIRGRKFDALTPLGKQLAHAYSKNVSSSKYYHQLSSTTQKRSTLAQYGEYSCICKIAEPTEERELLIKILFSKNSFPSATFLDFSRRDTLLLILDSIETCNRNNVKFTDLIFRNIIYLKQFQQDNEVLAYDQKFVSAAPFLWYLFQLHSYFSFAAETLLEAFVSSLKSNDSGLTIEEYISSIGASIGLIRNSLGIEPKERTLREFVQQLLLSYEIKSFDIVSLAHFENKCSLMSALNESILQSNIIKAIEVSDYDSAISQSVLLIIFVFLRCYRHLENADPKFIWYYSKAIEEFGVLSYSYEIAAKLLDMTVDRFIRYLFTSVIQQHDNIAYGKLLYGNDTFRFQEHMGRYFFKHDMKAKEKNSRVDTILSLLRELGLVYEVGSTLAVTPRSIELLHSVPR